MGKVYVPVILVLCAVSFCVNAQSPYQLNWKKELGISSASALIWGTSLAISKSVNEIPPETLAALDQGSVNAFDRWVINRRSQTSQVVSDYVLYTAYALPVLYLTTPSTRRDFGTIAVLYGETMAITAGLTLFAKVTTKRFRPLTYNTDLDLTTRLNTNNRFSFFSGHVSETAASCFFMAKVFSDYFPDSPARPYIWTAAVAIPMTNAWLRMNAGKHFPTDVLAGFTIGAATGFLVPHFHKKKSKKPEGNSLTIAPIPGGAFLSYRF
ncbi:MAG: phosphatase PAP2 family protein [Bacteroidota bacterium]